MAKRKSSAEDAPSFEDSLAELESIVHAMEHESLSLEKLVESYEQGSRLLAHCESVLRSARQRLETISLQAADPQTQDPGPSDPPAPLDPPTGPASDDDDIRLF